MSELISVIIPIYNVSAYLERCIESVVRQTYRHLQIILIDDGSTDRSSEICDEWGKRDDRIEVYHTLNRGLVRARKFGLVKSRGSYVCFVDGDDYIDANMYEELLEQIVEHEADFVHSGHIEEREGDSEVFISSSDVIHIKNREQRKLLMRQYLFGLDGSRAMTPSIWSKLFQRDIALDYMDCVPDEQSYGEDLIFLYFCFKKAKKIRVVDRAYYHYVIRENSIYHSSDSEYCLNEVVLWNCLIKKMDKADDDPKEISAWLIQKMAYVIEKIQKINVPRYYWAAIDDIYEKKVAVYGAGKVGRDYCQQMLEKGVQIVGVFDRKYKDRHIHGFDVMAPYEIKNVIFDVVIIAINSFEQAQIIRDYLICLGIDGTSIIWNKPNTFY